MEYSYITLYVYISISNTPTIVLVIYLYLKSKRIFHLSFMREFLIFHQLRFLSLLMRTNHNVKIYALAAITISIFQFQILDLLPHKMMTFDSMFDHLFVTPRFKFAIVHFCMSLDCNFLGIFFQLFCLIKGEITLMHQKFPPPNLTKKKVIEIMPLVNWCMSWSTSK